MAREKGKFRLYNRIWFLAISLVLFVLTLWGAASSFLPAALALEQETRCQMEEHVHTDACYVDTILACEQKAHTHSEQCYLVLLKDNDINTLLTAVDAEESNSLEGVIHTTLTRALAAEGVAAGDENLSFEGGTEELLPSATPTPTPTPTPTQTPDPSPSTTRGDDDPLPSTTRGDAEPVESPVATLSLTGTTLTDLNNTIADSGIEPALTLNTNLYAARAVAAAVDEEVSRAAEVPAVWPDLGEAGLCVWVADESKWVCIGTVEMTYNAGNQRYTLSRSQANSAYAALLGYEPGSGSNIYYYRSSGFSETVSANNLSSLSSSTRYTTTTIPYIYLAPGRTPTNFYRVTYDYLNQTDEAVYIRAGNSTTLPTLPDGHLWQNQTESTTMTGGQQVTVNASVTYRQTAANVSVTWIHPDSSSSTETRTALSGSATFDVAALASDYIWVDTEGNVLTGTTVSVSQNTTYRAVAKYYTITYLSSTGAILYADRVEYKTAYTLRDAPNGFVWADGSGIRYAGSIDSVTKDLTLYARVIATYSYDDGNTEVDGPHPAGTTITLPALSAGSIWTDEDGNNYNGGDSFLLNESMAFVESSSLILSYNVNFSDSGLSDGDTTPKLAENGQTTATVTIPVGASTTIYSVDPRTYVTSNDGEATHFVGWAPAGAAAGTYIQPGAVLTWEVLDQYAVDGKVTLNGDWNRDESNNITDVRFYVRFDSIPPDISGNVGSYGTNFYTAQVYHAYAGNAPAHNSGFNIVDKTADNSYTADQTIRALVGDKGDGELWISGVPDDAWLFEQLKRFTYENVTPTQRQNNEYLRIHAGKDANGNDLFETVPADKLDSDHYALRWYVFKKEGDGWHVDGRLVKKEGTITVDKIFGGIQDAVNQAREGFYILAENGTVTDGVFTPYAPSHNKYNTHILTLDQQTATALRSRYPNAIFQVYDQEVNANGEIIDEWLVTQVELDEYWQFTEMAVKPQYTDPTTGQTKYYSWYAEYSISDSDGEYSEISRFGSVAPVLGKTYALDEDADQGLYLDFTNYYYDNQSILIRKIDGDTGLPLGGAEFQLWQGGQQLKFRDNGTGIYSVSPDGNIGSIFTNSEGFSVITVDSFSYENGALVVREVTAPTGYAVVNDITVDYLNGTDGEAGIVDIVGADPADYSYHADYHDENGGILVVKDHAAMHTSVTVNKIWAEAVTEDEVTVVLQANGSRATNIFPSLSNVEMVLNAANGWSYTWQNLPAYANGKPVSWSVKEVKIGTETTMVGSDTFANWVVLYSTPVQTDSNGDGITDNWAVTVTNTVRRTMLNVIKTDADGIRALGGALFTLTEVEWDAGLNQWVDKAGATTLTAESGSDGRLLFDGLTAGVFYRLTELRAPDGYANLSKPVYLTVNGMGVVYGAANGAADTATLDAGLVTYTGPYVITARNIQSVPLPQTGGAGTRMYTGLGALLMAAAVILLVYEKRRREGIPNA